MPRVVVRQTVRLRDATFSVEESALRQTPKREVAGPVGQQLSWLMREAFRASAITDDVKLVRIYESVCYLSDIDVKP